ncbi:MAG: YfhO family protein [Acidobacteriota bacterium]
MAYVPAGKTGAVALGAALLVPLALLAPALVPGRALSSADLLLDSYLFADARPAGFAASNGLLLDPAVQMTPWRRFARDELRAGRIPLWNPHALAGSPLLGNPQAAVLDPLSLPYLLAGDPASASVWVALLRLALATTGAFLLARRLGASVTAAATTAVAYGCGGFMVVWLLYPNAGSAAWFPWVLLATERYLDGRSGRRLVALAATLALAILGGQVEVAFFAGLAAGAWALIRGAQERPFRGRRLVTSAGGLAAAGLLALLLTAVTVLPFFAALGEGEVTSSRQATWDAGARRARWELLPLQAFPYLFGRPLRGEAAVLGDFTNFCEGNGSYVSLLGLVLAMAGALASRAGSAARALAYLGALAFAFAGSFPPLGALVAHLPLVKLAPPVRAVFVVLLCLALLAGFGLDWLRAASLHRRARRLLQAAAALLILGALMAGALAWWSQAGLPNWEDAMALLRRLPVAGEWAGGRSLGELAADATRHAPVFGRRFLLPWAACAVAVALWLARGLRSRGRAWLLAAPALVAADLLHFGFGFNPAPPRDQVYPATSQVRAVAALATEGRVLLLDQERGNPANVATYLGWDDVLGYDVIGRRRLASLLAFADAGRGGTLSFPLLYFESADSWVLDALSVAGIASRKELRGDRFELVGRLGEGYLYHNPRRLPRAYLPPEIETVPDEAHAHTLLAAPDFDPARLAVVESAGLRRAAGEGELAWQRPAPARIRIAARMKRAGTIVVAEGYDPGWRATVDGEEAAVYPCNLALMAVAAPAGEHLVELCYRPNGWPLALWLSLAALLACLAIVWRGRGSGVSAGSALTRGARGC